MVGRALRRTPGGPTVQRWLNAGGGILRVLYCDGSPRAERRGATSLAQYPALNRLRGLRYQAEYGDYHLHFTSRVILKEKGAGTLVPSPAPFPISSSEEPFSLRQRLALGRGKRQGV
jgi:hypothetical protein